MAVTAVASGTETGGYGTFTVTLASPGVFTKTTHGLAIGDKLVFSTTGALPTGLTAGTTYYVISAGLTANDFQVSASDAGAAVNTSVSQSGTHTLVSEHFIDNINTAGTFTLHIDTNALAAGDNLEVRIYQMVLTGGTSRVVYYQPYPGAQVSDDQIKVSVPVSNELTDDYALRFSLRQTAGTGRAIPWKILKHA